LIVADKDINKQQLIASLEDILLQPRYASFMEAALTINDAYERGLVVNLDAFRLWGGDLAREIAGQDIKKPVDLIGSEDIPLPLKIALNSLLNGLYLKME